MPPAIRYREYMKTSASLKVTEELGQVSGAPAQQQTYCPREARHAFNEEKATFDELGQEHFCVPAIS